MPPAENSIFDKGVQYLSDVTQATKDGIKKVTSTETQSWKTKQKDIQTNYDYKYLNYPLNLGLGTRNPYYMTFFINVQDLSHLKQGASKGPVPLSTAAINASTTKSLAKNFAGTNLGFGRKTHRTKMAIRLYMPETLSWQYANSFREISLSGLPGAGIAQAIASTPALADSMTNSHQDGTIMGLLASLNTKEARASIAPLAEIAAEAMGIDPGLALSAVGISINPQVDVIYESPALREFAFDFLFAPRSADEAYAVAEIVKAFKFHAAPEMLGNGIGIGRYFVPPSEFDIEFSVPTMGKISTCVLQNINVDYASSGAAFYSDDHPVYTRLTLQFKELEYMTKELIDKGY